MKSLRRPISALNIGTKSLKSKVNYTMNNFTKKWDKISVEDIDKNKIDLDLLFEKQLQNLREINKEYDDEIMRKGKNENSKNILNENNVNSKKENNINMDILKNIKQKNNYFRSPSNYIRKKNLLPRINLSPKTFKNLTKEEPFISNNNNIHKNSFSNYNKKDNIIVRPITSKIKSSFHHKDYGKIPKYIQEMRIKAEIKKDIEKKKKEEEKYPKGTRLLPEEERLLTLRKLEESKKELENLIEKLPITLNSLSSKQKQQKLYKELDEVEKAIVIFSKDQVFVKIDS